MNNKSYISILALLIMLSSCTVGPKFRAPAVEVPQQYIGTPSGELSNEDMNWWVLFGDTTLIRLTQTAIANNKNLAMAISAVEQARITMKATRSDLWPSLQYDISGQYGNQSHIGTRSDKPTQAYIINPTISWELDLFGKIRRMVEADKNNLLATDMAARATLLALTAEVATTYFEYLGYEYAYNATAKMLESQTKTYALNKQGYNIGTVNRLDLEQSAAAMYQAQTALSPLKKAMEQSQYALSLLLGHNPSFVVGAHTPLIMHAIPSEVKAGIPSILLEKRPDIMEAYYNVAAANAMIGVAQAQRLPSVALTGSGGLLSYEFRDLFKSSALMWSASAGITGPLFNFGKYKRQVQVAREKHREATLNYEQTVLTAFNDVENSLSAVNNLREQTMASQGLLFASREAYRIAAALYSSGQTSYLNLLEAQRTLLNAEMGYSQTLTDLFSSYTALYKALGGGY